MDLRRLRAGEWIAAASGLTLLVSLWLPWWEIETPSGSLSGWEVMSRLDVLLALLGLAAVALWALTAIAKSSGTSIAADALLFPFALIVTIACVVRVLNTPGDLEHFGDLVGRAHGAWIGLGGCIGVLAGILVAMRDERLTSPEASTPADIELLPAPPTT